MSTTELEDTVATLSQQSEEIRENFRNLEKIGITSVDELLKSIDAIRQNVDSCVSGNKKSIEKTRTDVEGLSKKVGLTQLSEIQKCQEEISKKRSELEASNQKIVNLEKQLAECGAEHGKLQNPNTQQSDKIRMLEQQRLAIGAEAAVLRKERDLLLENLSKTELTIARIAALRKKCATRGKSFADEVGAATALQVNELESKNKNNQTTLQKSVDELAIKLKVLEETVSDAYEQECLLRDEQQNAQQQLQTLGEEEFKLKTMIEEEQKKLANALNSIAQLELLQKTTQDSLQQSEKELNNLKTQFDKLYQQELQRKAREEVLLQQVDELQQENNNLITKKQKEPVGPRKDDNLNTLAEENTQLRAENEELRAKVEVLTRQVNNLKATEQSLRSDSDNFLQQIQFLNTQLASAKEETQSLLRYNSEQAKENAKLVEDLTELRAELTVAQDMGARAYQKYTELLQK